MSRRSIQTSGVVAGSLHCWISTEMRSSIRYVNIAEIDAVLSSKINGISRIAMALRLAMGWRQWL